MKVLANTAQNKTTKYSSLVLIFGSTLSRERIHQVV
jgi:hypothetical protein